MTFATLRALHTIIGDALAEIEKVYANAGAPNDAAIDSTAGELVPGADAQYASPPPSPWTRSDVLNDASTSSQSPPSSEAHPTHTRSTSYSSSAPPASPAHQRSSSSPSLTSTFPCATRTPDPPKLDFPSLDQPQDPTSPAETLTSHPLVVSAINRIVAASGQLAASVQNPFLTICDASMGVSDLFSIDYSSMRRIFR